MDENAEIKRYTDEDGEWEVLAPGVKALVNPSQEWIDKHQKSEAPAKPTDADAITAEEALTILLGGEGA